MPKDNAENDISSMPQVFNNSVRRGGEEVGGGGGGGDGGGGGGGGGLIGGAGDFEMLPQQGLQGLVIANSALTLSKSHLQSPISPQKSLVSLQKSLTSLQKSEWDGSPGRAPGVAAQTRTLHTHTSHTNTSHTHTSHTTTLQTADTSHTILSLDVPSDVMVPEQKAEADEGEAASFTHCNTLQHTAPHCNTLQHTATHCDTLQHSLHLAASAVHHGDVLALPPAPFTSSCDSVTVGAHHDDGGAAPHMRQRTKDLSGQKGPTNAHDLTEYADYVTRELILLQEQRELAETGTPQSPLSAVSSIVVQALYRTGSADTSDSESGYETATLQVLQCVAVCCSV